MGRGRKKKDRMQIKERDANIQIQSREKWRKRKDERMAKMEGRNAETSGIEYSSLIVGDELN